MKDFFFAADLLTILRHDKYYGALKSLSVALRKIGLTAVERSSNIEQMLHALVIHIMDERGESEPFLAGAFIYPEGVIRLLDEKGLPAPDAMRPASNAKNNGGELIDEAQFERYFETVCRNCGTVTDPLANAYRTPIGRLIFRTFLETRLTLGINATGRYVLEHLENFDVDNVVTSVNEDSVTWLTEDSKEKITSTQTIAKFVLNFNREVDTLL